MDLLLAAAAASLVELTEVDPLRGGEHRPYVTFRSRHYECLRDVGRCEAERLRMGDRALGVRVREELVVRPRLVERAGQVFRCQRENLPSA